MELLDLREPLDDQTIPEPAVVGADISEQIQGVRQNRASQTAGTVLVQVYVSGAVHGCAPSPAGGPGRAA